MRDGERAADRCRARRLRDRAIGLATAVSVSLPDGVARLRSFAATARIAIITLRAALSDADSLPSMRTAVLRSADALVATSSTKHSAMRDTGEVYCVRRGRAAGKLTAL